MNTTLDYANPSTAQPPSLQPAIFVALLGCPLACILSLVLGVEIGFGFGQFSPGDLAECARLGAVPGAIGGLVVAANAWAFRPHAMKISIVGTFIVALGLGIYGIILGGQASA